MIWKVVISLLSIFVEHYYYYYFLDYLCLQCFDAVGWVA